MSRGPQRVFRLKRMLPQIAVYLVGILALPYIIRLAVGGSGENSANGWVIVLVVLGTAVLAILLLGGATALFSARNSVESMKIQQGKADGWPPASFAMRERLNKLGFEQFGSIDVVFSDHTPTFAGTLSPDGVTMAIVTPLHVVFLSDFDGKLLTTSSNAAGAPARYELRQTKSHGSVEQLWQLHQSGLDATRHAQVTPTVFNAASAMAAFLAIEEQSKNEFIMQDQIKYLASGSLLGRGVKNIAKDPNSEAQIVGWRDSPHRWRLA